VLTRRPFVDVIKTQKLQRKSYLDVLCNWTMTELGWLCSRNIRFSARRSHKLLQSSLIRGVAKEEGSRVNVPRQV